MEGWRFIVDVGIATVVAVLLGAVLSFLFNIWVDSKGWKKVNEKIGDTSRGSLNIQHEDIKDTIKFKTNSIEKAITEKTSSICTKVDNIDKITARNEFLYQNLNDDQKKVRDNVNKLVLDWEKTISENKELKSDNKNLMEQLNRITLENKNLVEVYREIKENNTTVKSELNSFKISLKDANVKIDNLKLENKYLKEENAEIKNDNKKLSEHLKLAKQMLDIGYKSKDQGQDLDIKPEDDEENEI